MTKIWNNFLVVIIIIAGLGLIVFFGEYIGAIIGTLFIGSVALKSLYKDEDGKVKVISLPGRGEGDDDM